MDRRTRLQLKVLQWKDARYAEVASNQQERTSLYVSKKKDDLDKLAQLAEYRSQGPHTSSTTFGLGYAGFGNGWTEAKPRILYPKERKRPRRHLREVSWSRESLRSAASKDEMLVPIRLDIDFDRYKLRDTFTWNLHDNSLPFDLFAEHLCDDYGLPTAGFVNEINKSMKAQLADHHPHKFPEEQEADFTRDSRGEVIQYTDTKDDDLRIPIRLDVTVGNVNLVDQIEWDLNNSLNCAEQYADHFCQELGLTMEFSSAIAHSIREQCQMYTKSLFLVGHSFDGKEVMDSDLRQSLMPAIFDAIRPRHQLDLFAPALSELSVEQLDRVEREREREGRRNRRQTRGKRGANLPDLNDLPKTYRTSYRNEVLLDEHQSSSVGLEIQDTAHMLHEDDDMSDTEIVDSATDGSRHDRNLRASRAYRLNQTSLSGQISINRTGHKTQSQQPQNRLMQAAALRSSGTPVSKITHKLAQTADVLEPRHEQLSMSLAFDTGSCQPRAITDQIADKIQVMEFKMNQGGYSSLDHPTNLSPPPSLIVKLRIPKLRMVSQSTRHTGSRFLHDS